MLLALAAVASCHSGDSTSPEVRAASSSAFTISDGANGIGGNPDFFFLPPVVANPKKSPNYTEGAFNGKLLPTVAICELDATTDAQVNPGTLCKSGGYSLTVQLTAADVGDEQYHINWQVPVSSAVFFRVNVKVGLKVLGFFDAKTASNSSQLKNVNTGELVPLVDGRTLPVNFRIEQCALCDTPGSSTGTSQTLDLSSGGTVETILPGSTAPSGVEIPAQPGGTNPVTITVQTCPNLNPRVTDLPTFGSCVRVTADPQLPPSGLAQAATVFVCDLSGSIVIGGNVVDEAQEKRITMHRFDDGETPTLTALQHTVGCPVVLGAASSSGSFGGLVHAIASGHWKSAGGEVLGMLKPAVLYAATRRRIDEGGGGLSSDFSDFQFALPAKMEKVTGDNQIASPSTTLPSQPTVLVTDLGGEPVKGARVRFSTSNGSVTPSTYITGSDGYAYTGWTLGAAAGSNSMIASGHGIAGADNNGPRPGIDPFQPLKPAFGDATLGGPVAVLTGSQTFSATGGSFSDGFETDLGWTVTGFWHRSTLAGATNVLVPGTVNLAPGDASGGALPAPKSGSYAFWYGEQASGNYRGPGTGYSSDVANSGISTSPEFAVPTSTLVIPTLTFDTWWEIESVNPHSFDLMKISVVDVAASTTTQLGVLNPTSDPGGNATTPFTSGGFNAPPVWTSVSVDLSAFRGKTIRIVFSFSTQDALYNGYRGWIVDNVQMTSAPAVAGLRAAPSGSLAPSNSLNPVPPPGIRP